MANQSQKLKWWEYPFALIFLAIIGWFVVYLTTSIFFPTKFCEWFGDGCYISIPCDSNYEDCGPAGPYPAYEYGD